MGRELLPTLAKEYLKEDQEQMDLETQLALKQQLKQDREIKCSTHKVTAIGMANTVEQIMSNVQLQVCRLIINLFLQTNIICLA